MSSFAELAVLRDQIWRAKESSQVPMIVVGNKWDLVDQGDRQVSTDVGARFAEESKALFVETSAKTGLHVDEMFIELVRNIVRARQSDRQGGSACEPSVSEKIQPKLAKEQSRTKSPSGSRSKEWDSGGKKNHRCCTIM
ncbi:Ras- protein Rap-2b [Gamsiella multidivaricata]|nr:Ras- protein Rap-2b [Gamsiella multidivaricata]